MKTRVVAAVALSAFALARFTMPSGYEGWPRADKLKYLLAQVNQDQQSGPFRSVNMEQIWAFLHTSYLWATQNHVSDEIPPDHKKYIHAVGAVGSAHFEWDEGQGYTGLFKEADACLLRFSSAATPMPVPDNYLLPGVGVKCLRDGVDSGNFVAMWQLDGYAMYPPQSVESCSYFKVPFSNHVANRDDLPFAIRTGAYISFARVDAAPGFVGLSGFAEWTQGGEKEANPNFPFALVFDPTPEARALPCEKDVSMDQIKNIRPGMVLYDVYAVPKAVDNPQKGDLVHIGKLKADSKFVTSKYGDETLFYRHDFFAKDQAYHPEWKGLENDDGFKAKEGVMKYMPLLPDFNETWVTENKAMLSTDVVV